MCNAERWVFRIQHPARPRRLPCHARMMPGRWDLPFWDSFPGLSATESERSSSKLSEEWATGCRTGFMKGGRSQATKLDKDVSRVQALFVCHRPPAHQRWHRPCPDTHLAKD